MPTDRKVKALKSKEKQYKVSDEKGLYLLVKTNGQKYWRLKCHLSSKEKNLAIGVYPNDATTLSIVVIRNHQAKIMCPV